jgi:hypothetical protein
MQLGTEEVVEVIINDLLFLLMGPLKSATHIFQTGYEVLLSVAISFEVKEPGTCISFFKPHKAGSLPPPRSLNGCKAQGSNFQFFAQLLLII